MRWLLAILARVALLCVWIWTPLVTRAFQGVWPLPLLGLLFLPVTTLVYVLVSVPGVGVTGWGWLWLVLALLFDLGAHSSAAYTNRHRLSGYRAARDQRRGKAC